MVVDPGVQQLEPDPAQIRREFLEGPATYARLFGLFHEHHAARLGKPRWGDQLGFVERFADPIFEAFPEARMIHMIRDPRALMGREATADRRRGSAGWATGRWLRSAELAERNLRRYPDRYRVVRYETLAEHSLDTVLGLCAFIEEEYVPDMGDVLATVRFDVDGSPGGSMGEVEGTVRRVPAEVAFVDAYAAGKLIAFEYPVTPSRPSDRLAYTLVDRPINRAAMAAWRLFRGRPSVLGGSG
jgi:hypothetical protein